MSSHPRHACTRQQPRHQGSPRLPSSALYWESPASHSLWRWLKWPPTDAEQRVTVKLRGDKLITGNWYRFILLDHCPNIIFWYHIEFCSCCFCKNYSSDDKKNINGQFLSFEEGIKRKAVSHFTLNVWHTFIFLKTPKVIEWGLFKSMWKFCHEERTVDQV